MTERSQRKFVFVFLQEFLHFSDRIFTIKDPAVFFGEADEFLETSADALLVDAEILVELIVLMIMEDYIFIDIDQKIPVQRERVRVSP